MSGIMSQTKGRGMSSDRPGTDDIPPRLGSDDNDRPTGTVGRWSDGGQTAAACSLKLFSSALGP